MPGPDVDYVGDCQDLSQFADEVVDEIYASHIIEQLGHGDELGKALGEIRRVLKSNGTLRLSVPDWELLGQELVSPTTNSLPSCRSCDSGTSHFANQTPE